LGGKVFFKKNKKTTKKFGAVRFIGKQAIENLMKKNKLKTNDQSAFYPKQKQKRFVLLCTNGIPPFFIKTLNGEK